VGEGRLLILEKKPSLKGLFNGLLQLKTPVFLGHLWMNENLRCDPIARGDAEVIVYLGASH
jgi:hypothetical protein